MSEIKRIGLWSGPRNVSTALMYSFAQRQDTKVLDEPLYGYYLKHVQPKIDHPGTQEILSTMENDEKKVVASMLGHFDHSVVFFKNMAHHIRGLEMGFLSELQNVILTREPKDVILSFSKVIDNPSIDDLGSVEQLKILRYLLSQGQTPIVVDGRQIRNEPEETLTRLCERLGIEFDPKMLQWQPGARSEDGIWAKYWYANVHQSTGFIPYPDQDKDLPEQYHQLLAESLLAYEELMEWRL